MIYKKNFWKKLEILVNESEIVIDRPKSSAYPKYPDLLKIVFKREW
jgi:inorganic pyrophosphatase